MVKNRSIRVLNISRNKLAGAGTATLELFFHFLCMNCTLQTLLMDGNRSDLDTPLTSQILLTSRPTPLPPPPPRPSSFPHFSPFNHFSSSSTSSDCRLGHEWGCRLADGFMRNSTLLQGDLHSAETQHISSTK